MSPALIRVCAVALLCAAFSCTTDKFTGPQAGNKPPTVWLSSAPPEGSVSSYTVRLFWGGWDPDGEISRFEYQITNNETGVFDPVDTLTTWGTLEGNDSIFTLSADVFVDSLNANWRDDIHDSFEYRRSHTFFIRAVDNKGARSRAVYRSFTSRTLSPTVFIDAPLPTGFDPARVPPVTTFRWTGKDFVNTEAQEQDPESVRVILVGTAKFNNSWDATMDYIRNTPDAEEWSPWLDYDAADNSGREMTTSPLDGGNYVFAVQVKDEAGAISPVFDLARNARRLLVRARPSGPILRVTNEYLGTTVTSSGNTPAQIADLPANIPIMFCWSADASSYGGRVCCYRYGWDLLDLNSDEGWERDWTPFVGTEACSDTRRYPFGTRTFYLEVRDNSGFTTRYTARINIIQFTMSRPLLVIDDWIEGPESSTGWTRSRGIVPTDAEHDQFWIDMLSDVDDFDPALDFIEVGPGTGLSVLPISIAADYRNIIWSSQGSTGGNSATVLSDVIAWRDPEQTATSGRVQPNVPALFMAAGGHLMLTGDRVMTLSINYRSAAPVFPFIFRYELAGDLDGAYTGDNEVGVRGVGETSFAYRDCCLNVLDIGYLSGLVQVRRPPNQNKPPGTGCPVDELRDHNELAPPNSITDGMRAVNVHPAAGFAWPRLELRQEATGTAQNPLFHWEVGINYDVYNPMYFNDLTACGNGGVAELVPQRSCFQPIYGVECRNTGSHIFGAPVAFWTSTHADAVALVGGVPARSCVFGFHPVFMKPEQVKPMIEHVVFDEWQLPRK